MRAGDFLRHILAGWKSKWMTTLRHPNVVLFMAASTKPPKMCIVMELMALGSLHEVIRNFSPDECF